MIDDPLWSMSKNSRRGAGRYFFRQTFSQVLSRHICHSRVSRRTMLGWSEQSYFYLNVDEWLMCSINWMNPFCFIFLKILKRNRLDPVRSGWHSFPPTCKLNNLCNWDSALAALRLFSNTHDSLECRYEQWQTIYFPWCALPDQVPVYWS